MALLFLCSMSFIFSGELSIYSEGLAPPQVLFIYSCAFIIVSTSHILQESENTIMSITEFPLNILEFPVYVYKEIDLIQCGGIEVRSLRASAIGRKKPLGEPVLEKFQFIPHISIQVSTAAFGLNTRFLFDR